MLANAFVREVENEESTRIKEVINKTIFIFSKFSNIRKKVFLKNHSNMILLKKMCHEKVSTIEQQK